MRETGDDTPRRTVSLLVAAVADCRDTDWLTGQCPVLTVDQTARVVELCRKRAAGFPLQYLIGHTWFCGHRFLVRPGVLIPRPDTEILVRTAVERIEGEMRPSSGYPESGVLRILDIGTGTGCVGISLALALDELGIGYGIDLVDLSGDALELAGENLSILKPGGQMTCLCCDLFPTGEIRIADVIVSNPPYIPSEVIPGLMPEVSVHEPVTALDGGTDGLEMIRRIVAGAAYRLRQGGCLLLEHGYDQGEAVRDIFLGTGGYGHVTTIRDFGGNERVTYGYCEAPVPPAGRKD